MHQLRTHLPKNPKRGVRRATGWQQVGLAHSSAAELEALSRGSHEARPRHVHASCYRVTALRESGHSNTICNIQAGSHAGGDPTALVRRARFSYTAVERPARSEKEALAWGRKGLFTGSREGQTIAQTTVREIPKANAAKGNAGLFS